MAIQALYTAATGMKAMDTKLNVVANNLANVETVAFKRSRANFADILYQTLERPGLRGGLGTPLPTGKQIGVGTQLSSIALNFEQGAPEITNGELDMLIKDDGFFQVLAFVDGAETALYTRAGNFTLDSEGAIVLDNGIGAVLDPGITVPSGADDISISQTGLVQAVLPGSSEHQDIGQIELARFVNSQGLEQLGDNLFRQTDASGEPILGVPSQDGMGVVIQGQLERSNVDPVRELVALIQTQRSFELNSQSLQAADQTLQTLVNITRF